MKTEEAHGSPPAELVSLRFKLDEVVRQAEQNRMSIKKSGERLQRINRDIRAHEAEIAKLQESLQRKR